MTPPSTPAYGRTLDHPEEANSSPAQHLLETTRAEAFNHGWTHGAVDGAMAAHHRDFRVGVVTAVTCMAMATVVFLLGKDALGLAALGASMASLGSLATWAFGQDMVIRADVHSANRARRAEMSSCDPEMQAPQTPQDEATL